MPIFRYNMSASLTNQIADSVVKPNLSLALIARDVMIGSMYGGFAAGGLFLLGAVWILAAHAWWPEPDASEMANYGPLSSVAASQVCRGNNRFAI
jgi:hypothetical protein